MALDLSLSLNAPGGSRVQPITGLTATIGAAYGLRRLVPAYTGSAVRVRRTADNVQQDIGFAPNGGFDTAALLALIGSGDAVVVTWYDQSGNGYNLTQGTAAVQPIIALSGAVRSLSGRPTVFGTSTRFIRAGSAASGLHSSGLWSAVLAGSTTTTGLGIFATADDQGSNRGAQFIRTNTTLQLQTVGFDTTPTAFTATGGTLTSDTAFIGSAVRGLTDITAYLNGVSGTPVAVSGTESTAFAALTLFGNGVATPGNLITGNISEAVFLRGAASAADRQAVERNMGAYLGISVA